MDRDNKITEVSNLVDHKQKNFLIETRAGITVLLYDREEKSNRLICFDWLAECQFICSRTRLNFLSCFLRLLDTR